MSPCRHVRRRTIAALQGGCTCPRIIHKLSANRAHSTVAKRRKRPLRGRRLLRLLQLKVSEHLGLEMAAVVHRRKRGRLATARMEASANTACINWRAPPCYCRSTDRACIVSANELCWLNARLGHTTAACERPCSSAACSCMHTAATSWPLQAGRPAHPHSCGAGASTASKAGS